MKKLQIKPLWIVLGLLILVLQYQLWFQSSGIVTLMHLRSQVAEQEKENAALRARNDLLKEQVAELKSDPEALEAQAREELGLVKEGEVYYRVIKEKRKAS